MHELATSVHRMTLGERFSITAQEIRAVMDQFVEKTWRGIQLASCRRLRELVDLPMRGWGVSHSASRPTTPHPNVADGSSWHRAGSTPAQFAVLSSASTGSRSTRSRPLPSCDEFIQPFGTRRFCSTRSHTPGTSSLTRRGHYSARAVGLRMARVVRSLLGLHNCTVCPD